MNTTDSVQSPVTVHQTISSLNMAIELRQFCIDNISFQETRPNMVIDGSFTKMIYADDTVMFNSLFILFDDLHKYLSIPSFIKGNGNIQYIVVQNSNRTIQGCIYELAQFEKSIMGEFIKHRRCSKIMSFSLSTQLQKGVIKLIHPKGNSTWRRVIVKVSGVWEDNTHIGITCKFIGI